MYGLFNRISCISSLYINLYTQVMLIDPEGPSILYQTHIASEFSTGIISMHFEMCSFHGFEKNVMIITTKDSSVFALEKDTGNTLSSGVVHPTKPKKALFTQILGEHLFYLEY